MALAQLRHFVVYAPHGPDLGRIPLEFEFRPQDPINVNLATLLEANAKAEHEVEWNLRYRVLQNELRIVLSYLSNADTQLDLQLDIENFVGTAAHIKRFVSESVGLGMLTAAVEQHFSWQYDPGLIYNFDVLPGEMQNEFTNGVRPDLLFKFDDGLGVLAGEARGRSGVGPLGDIVRTDQRKRMDQIVSWSADNGAYPVTMTWAYLGGKRVQVDLFTMSDESIGSVAYQAKMEEFAAVTQREQVTIDAVGRGERRAQRLFETAPPAPAREPRRLFDREVRGDWVTADFAQPSNVRMFLGVMDQPIPQARLRTARSRRRRAVGPERAEYETALSDRLLVVVTESHEPEPEWSRVEAAVREIADES